MCMCSQQLLAQDGDWSSYPNTEGRCENCNKDEPEAMAQWASLWFVFDKASVTHNCFNMFLKLFLHCHYLLDHSIYTYIVTKQVRPELSWTSPSEFAKNAKWAGISPSPICDVRRRASILHGSIKSCTAQTDSITLFNPYLACFRLLRHFL